MLVIKNYSYYKKLNVHTSIAIMLWWSENGLPGWWTSPANFCSERSRSRPCPRECDESDLEQEIVFF